MPSVINTNVSSLSAQRNLYRAQREQGSAMQRLSSGLRVNSARDDASGLAVALQMEYKIRGSTVALRAVNDGISALQTADGALAVVTDMFQRIRELWHTGQNESLDAETKLTVSREMQGAMNGITDIFNRTDFNGKKLLIWDGVTGSTLNTWSAEIKTSSESDTFKATIFNATLDGFGDPDGYPNLISPVVTIPNQMQGQAMGLEDPCLTNIDQSMTAIVNARANIGAQLNVFDGIISNLYITHENISAARGRIVDADFAVESANLAKSRVLQDAGMAMVTQANAQLKNVLQLLGG